MTDPYRPLKDAFGRFATGVAVAGCKRPDGRPVFLTINSFTSVSLDPPLVLWCIERKAAVFDLFMNVTAYSITVLHSGQQHISERFARHDPAVEADEFETWSSGAPILKDRLAGFDCRVIHRHLEGDHAILVAKVERYDSTNGAPLLYYASRYAKGPEAEQ